MGPVAVSAEVQLHNLAELLQDQGDLSGAKKSEMESLVIQRQLKNKRGIGNALWALGNFALAEGDLNAAAGYQKDALSLWGELGAKNTEARSRLSLSLVSFEQGHLDLARMFAQRAAAEFREKTEHMEAGAQARFGKCVLPR